MTIPNNYTEVPEPESLRNVLPLSFCASAIPTRINKLKESRLKLIAEIQAINNELTSLETIDLLNKSNGY